jgi:hypothetical protein
MRTSEEHLLKVMSSTEEDNYILMFMALLADQQKVLEMIPTGEITHAEAAKAIEFWRDCTKTILIKQYMAVAITNIKTVAGDKGMPDVLIKMADEYLDTGKVTPPGFTPEGQLR